MSWKLEISNQINEASKQRKIGRALKVLAKLLLIGDTRFNLVYSKSRDSFITVIFRESLSRSTSKLLLQNGYKQIYLQWKDS